MKILIMKFRVNDLDPSIGKQIEFSNKIVQDFFEFKKDKEYIDFIYNDYAFKPFYNKKVIHVYLSLSPARGDYKVYQNEDNSLFLKNFFIQNLGLSPEKNKNDYFTLTKLSSTQYALSYIPCESDLGKLIIGNQLKSGDVVEAIEDNEKTQKRTRINRLRKKLEEYAIANNLLVSVDGSGERVVFQNGFIIDVSKNILYTCINSDVFNLLKNPINKLFEGKDYWHICSASEDFPSTPYEYSKVREIVESADDKCLYAEITDDSKFEMIFGELIETLTEQQLVSEPMPFIPSQIIYYGVPGCGKSYEVNKVINDELDKYGVTDKEYHKVRCVFHPEYCNADFVGQIYPYVKPDNGGVEYRFKPGPFAEIVRRAYRNPAEPFFLVVEEINRGNAAAIFGEMFQLLDRIRPEDGPEELSGNIYNTGWSSYGVTNIDVNAYVRQKSTDNPEKIEYDDSIPYGDKIKFINNTAVRLPPNLSIYATMNTNDQNVFTMDNAFQRRFKSKMIRNVLDENSAQYKTEIDDTGVCWGDFREWINEKILLPQTAVLKADDKCLGGWFITGEKINGVDKIRKEDFAEKVLKYLWDDVFKRNKSGEIFVKDDKVKSLSDLIDAFETSVGFESFEKIIKMNDVDKAKLQKQANT